jgi:hypothetical protein
MAEKTTRQKKYESHIPEEARQHFRAAREEMRKSVELLLPEGFLEHRKSARREMLLGHAQHAGCRHPQDRDGERPEPPPVRLAEVDRHARNG